LNVELNDTMYRTHSAVGRVVIARAATATWALEALIEIWHERVTWVVASAHHMNITPPGDQLAHLLLAGRRRCSGRVAGAGVSNSKRCHKHSIATLLQAAGVTAVLQHTHTHTHTHTLTRTLYTHHSASWQVDSRR